MPDSNMDRNRYKAALLSQKGGRAVLRGMLLQISLLSRDSCVMDLVDLGGLKPILGLYDIYYCIPARLTRFSLF
jgi:hypothetical protein